MGLLGALRGLLVEPGFGRQVVFAVPALDVIPHLGESRACHLGGVGTHVGDQADRSAASYCETFVQLLGHGHGPLSGETQLPAGFLL